MMTSEAKTGVMAAGIVLGFVAVVGGILLAVNAAGRPSDTSRRAEKSGKENGVGAGTPLDPPQPTVKKAAAERTAERPVPAGHSVADLAAHPFWTKRVKEEDVSKLLDELSTPGVHGFFLIDDQFKVWRDQTFTGTPEGCSKYNVLFIPETNPKREVMAAKLKKLLDAALAKKNYDKKYPRD